MITALFHITIKPGREDEFREVARQLTKSTHAEDEGCISYTTLQQESNAREYVVFEQWRDQDALDAHIRRLQVVYGPPHEGGRLPARLMDLYERTQGVRYVPIV